MNFYSQTGSESFAGLLETKLKTDQKILFGRLTHALVSPQKLQESLEGIPYHPNRTKYFNPKDLLIFEFENYRLSIHKLTQTFISENIVNGTLIKFDGRLTIGSTSVELENCTIDSKGNIRLNSDLGGELESGAKDLRAKDKFFTRQFTKEGEYSDLGDLVWVRPEFLRFASVGRLEANGKSLQMRFFNHVLLLNLKDKKSFIDEK